MLGHTLDDLQTAYLDFCDAWPAVMPPTRCTVSEGVAATLRIGRPGSGCVPYSLEETPYMREPLDSLGSRKVAGVVFVGPAQSGKTAALGEGWMSHNVCNDAGDMVIVQMTQDKAREYSIDRIDRAIRNSPKLGELMPVGGKSDNIHDKMFRNGMRLKIAWPTVANASSTSYRYFFGTDYDRWPDNIDGEGDGWTLFGARPRTYRSRGKRCIESSPGRPLVDPSWRAATAHEAPPVGGILGVYNTTDRRRHYWKCPHCREWLQASPGLGLFNLPSDDELLESIRTLDVGKFSAQYARVICPHSGCIINFDHRRQMNRTGIWLPEGLSIDADDRMSGDPRGGKVRGYWLSGVAAAYSTWEELINKHVTALLDYSLTGQELKLQATANVDQGVPYMARYLADSQKKGGTSPRDRTEPLERYVVPDEARYILKAVDVQGGKNARFVVETHAIGYMGEEWLIDRKDIRQSKRDYAGELAPLDPAGYAEDWQVLEDELAATYRTSDPDRELKVHALIVDTGGEDGVTLKAYQWMRRLRVLGLQSKVVLSKGDKEASARIDWMTRKTMVGGTKTQKPDVELHLLNSNKWKDAVAAALRREVPGPGYYHVPHTKKDDEDAPDHGWLSPTWFDELLNSEVRLENGKWSKIKPRNESLDLCYMLKALQAILGADKPRFWEHPPPWARALDDGNTGVVAREERRAMAAQAEKKADRPPARRQSRSSYLS